MISEVEFRRCASMFVTGVTIVTTVGREGGFAGLTANSFTTVSLNPPLILFCLGKASTQYAAFVDCEGFAVHVASAGQRDLAARFATRGEDRFAGLEVEMGAFGAPIIPGALAVFECERYKTYDSGDHTVFVGLVHKTRLGDSKPRVALGYFQSHFIEIGLDDMAADTITDTPVSRLAAESAP